MFEVFYPELKNCVNHTNLLCLKCSILNKNRVLQLEYLLCILDNLVIQRSPFNPWKKTIIQIFALIRLDSNSDIEKALERNSSVNNFLFFQHLTDFLLNYPKYLLMRNRLIIINHIIKCIFLSIQGFSATQTNLLQVKTFVF